MRAHARQAVMGDGRAAEFGVILSSPCEHLVFDVIVHRDLAFMLDGPAVVYNRIFAQGSRPLDWGDGYQLPVDLTVRELEGSVPNVRSVCVSGYTRMAKFVYASLGSDASEFVGLRIEMDHPPTGSSLFHRFERPLEVMSAGKKAAKAATAASG